MKYKSQEIIGDKFLFIERDSLLTFHIFSRSFEKGIFKLSEKIFVNNLESDDWVKLYQNKPPKYLEINWKSSAPPQE